jgi:hypothetical protein
VVGMLGATVAVGTLVGMLVGILVGHRKISGRSGGTDFFSGKTRIFPLLFFCLSGILALISFGNLHMLHAPSSTGMDCDRIYR